VAWGAGALVAASVTAVAVLDGTALRGSPTVDRAATSSASCVREYSPREVSRRAFAVDGTVVSLGPSHSDRPRGVLHHAGVTFAVHEWFFGGSGTTVTVDMPHPGGWSEDGFVTNGLRYHDEATADSWRAATR